MAVESRRNQYLWSPTPVTHPATSARIFPHFSLLPSLDTPLMSLRPSLAHSFIPTVRGSSATASSTRRDAVHPCAVVRSRLDVVVDLLSAYSSRLYIFLLYSLSTDSGTMPSLNDSPTIDFSSCVYDQPHILLESLQL